MAASLKCPACGQWTKRNRSPHEDWCDLLRDDPRDEDDTIGEIFLCPCKAAVCIFVDGGRTMAGGEYRWFRYDPKGFE